MTATLGAISKAGDRDGDAAAAASALAHAGVRWPWCRGHRDADRHPQRRANRLRWVPITTTNATIVGSVSVTVPAGLTTAVSVSGLTIGTAPVTATLNGTATATVNIVPPPPVVTALAPVRRSPLTRPLARAVFLQVTINRAPTDPTVITLQNSATSVVTVPPSVTVAAGQLTASFPVTTQTQGQATITASFNSTSATAQVVVTAPEVESLTVAPAAPTAFAGESVAFTATGLFTDGSSQPLARTTSPGARPISQSPPLAAAAWPRP